MAQFKPFHAISNCFAMKACPTFKPGLRNGKPETFTIEVTVSFRLQQRSARSGHSYFFVSFE